VPPVKDEYQSINCPAKPDVAEISTDPAPHLNPFTLDGTGVTLTVAVTGTLVEEEHPVVVFLV
jgi:hypothetical protein